MNSSLPDDRYKHNLFIHYDSYNCFQTFHAHRNEAINYKNLYLINFFNVNNVHLQDDF